MNKKTFRNTAITTMAATATVAAVAPAAAADVQFEDVSQESDHYEAIMTLVDQDAISGYEDGTFRPYEDVDRGQVAKILTNSLGLETPENMEDVLSAYTDVDTDHEYAEAIAAVTEAGVFGGSEDNEFNPWESISREQMASVLVEAYDLNEYEGEEVELNADEISEEHVDSVQKLVNLGISNNPSEFNAWDPIQRDQFSSFVVRTQETVAEHAEPTVESVSAITTNTVEVTIEEPKKDVFGYTVDVLDSEGNKVEVDPVDVSEGQTEVSLKFSNAVDSEDLTGVWTVDGKEYSFTVIEQFNTIMDAASEDPVDELELQEALNDAGIENVDENNLQTYADEIVDANPENLVDIQAAVNEANKSDEQQQSEAEALEDVIDASNQVQLYQALQNNFERVNSDWVVDYASESIDGTELLKYTKKADGDISYDAVQELVDGVNIGKSSEAVNGAKDSLDRNDVSKARTLVNSYVKDSKEDELGTKDYGLDNLDEIEAIIDVNEATTNNTLKQALVDLDKLENNLVDKYDGYTKDDFKGLSGSEPVIEDTIDLDTVHDDLLADYRTKIGDVESVGEKNQRSDIQGHIEEVNNSFGGFAFTDAADDDNNVLEVTSGKNIGDLTVQAVEKDGDVDTSFDESIGSVTVTSDDFDDVTDKTLNFSTNSEGTASEGTATISVGKSLSDLGSTDAAITFSYDDKDYTVTADIQVVAGDVDKENTKKTMEVNVPDDETYTSGDDITTSFTLKDEAGNTLSHENGTYAAEINVNGDTFYQDITFENGAATVTVPARSKVSNNSTNVTIKFDGNELNSSEKFNIEAADFSELNISGADASGFDLVATDGVNNVNLGQKIVNVSVEDKDGNAVDISGLKASENTIDYQGNIKVDLSNKVTFTEAGLDADTKYTITTTVDGVTETKTFTTPK